MDLAELKPALKPLTAVSSTVLLTQGLLWLLHWSQLQLQQQTGQLDIWQQQLSLGIRVAGFGLSLVQGLWGLLTWLLIQLFGDSTTKQLLASFLCFLHRVLRGLIRISLLLLDSAFTLQNLRLTLEERLLALLVNQLVRSHLEIEDDSLCGEVCVWHQPIKTMAALVPGTFVLQNRGPHAWDEFLIVELVPGSQDYICYTTNDDANRRSPQRLCVE